MTDPYAAYEQLIKKKIKIMMPESQETQTGETQETPEEEEKEEE